VETIVAWMERAQGGSSPILTIPSSLSLSHTQAYCDVRRARVDVALAALASPVPVEGADGEGGEAVREWIER
jgi:hypothetical protein